MSNVEVVPTVSGHWIILVGGLQYGGKRDASGAGDAYFDTEEEAWAYFEEQEK